MADVIADLECRALAGGDHLADGPALQGLTDLEGRHVAFTVNHAAAHVGVDRHPDVADENLALLGVGDRGLDIFEIVGGWHADGAAFQANFISCQV